MATGKTDNSTKRVIFDAQYSSLEHSCDSGTTRKRMYNADDVLAVPSPQKPLLKVAESHGGLEKLQVALGLPPMSSQVAMKVVRQNARTTREHVVLEFALLPVWLAECQKVDPLGMYKYESKDRIYHGTTQTTCLYWVCAPGFAKQIVDTTAVIFLRAIDSGHWKHEFGGVLFVIATATADRGILPLLFGGASVEDTDRLG